MPKRQSSRRRGPVRAVLRAALGAAPFLATVALMLWALSHNPFAHPFVAATNTQVQRAIERALALQVTPEWVAQELDLALGAGDLDRVGTLVLIAQDHGLAPAAEQQARIEALTAEHSDIGTTVGTCVACMADIGTCQSPRLMAACGVPFELTPLGDVNALRRAGMAMWAGDEVDRLDATLAVVGLAATGAVVATGGTSITIKAGTSVLRMGHRLKRLKPGLLQMLNIGLKPSMIGPWLLGRVPTGALVDTARLDRLQKVTGDLSRVVRNTSMTDSVLLLNHVDDAADAARLARVSDITGTRTQAAFDILGKQRVFRALVRLSDAALATAAIIYAAILQLVLSVASWIGNMIFRPAVKTLAHRV